MTTKIVRPAEIGVPYFSRASTATYIGSDGLLKTAAVDVRRPKYVGAVQDGWIYEPAAATNLLIQSNADSTIGWTKGPNLTRVGNSTAPDGTNTATTYQGGSDGNAYIRQELAWAAATTYTISVWARLVSGSAPTVGALIAVDYDTDGNSGTLERSTLLFAGLGLTSTWKRFSLTTTNVAAVASGTAYLCADFNTGVQVAIWGAQLEVGGMSSYIPTTTAAATRAAEVSNEVPRELVSSTAVETVPLWNPATSYIAGTKVRRDTVQRIFQNVTAGVNAELPETVGSTRWVDIAPTNKAAMFDKEVGSVTTGTDSISVVLRPGSISGLALQEMSNANQVRVVMKEAPGGVVVYDKTVDLEFAPVLDVYDWFFLPYEARTDAQLTDLPEFPGCEVTGTITGSGSVGCGLLAVGTAVELGEAEFGATLGILNRSIITTNAYGRTTITKRGYHRTMDLKVWVPSNGRNRFYRFLSEIKDTPCVYIGDDGDGNEAMIVYGLYRDFSIVLSFPGWDLYNVRVEGMTL